MDTHWHPNTLVIKGFPKDNLDLSIHELVSYFEDRAQSGGGELRKSNSFPGIVPFVSGKECLIVFLRNEGTI